MARKNYCIIIPGFVSVAKANWHKKIELWTQTSYKILNEVFCTWLNRSENVLKGGSRWTCESKSPWKITKFQTTEKFQTNGFSRLSTFQNLMETSRLKLNFCYFEWKVRSCHSQTSATCWAGKRRTRNHKSGKTTNRVPSFEPSEKKGRKICCD